ncbi:MAG TPA: ParA family protein [Desulfuromonadales bacterium]|nr:ParA family protein [Desulfuromonadales bacterium]
MSRPYVVTISSEKGGVGKTTVATNLAIYLKALAEDLPVTLFSFDNHFTVDRMFRIGRGVPRGDMHDLMEGIPAETLVETGQYGVQFIPSTRRLAELRGRLNSPDTLARLLAASALSGIVIIDTRPDLDIFTQNALYAADRVIVPVKDTPSLENCRSIYDFFDRQGLSRRPLRILPCLVDSRIRFDGPFRDLYRLLKGYAINRGYRCLEGFIAKSPKVESLSTNPDGKVYPVITHGRGTEVHIQFAHLARQIFLGAQQEGERRLDQVHREIDQQQTQRGEAYRARRERLQPDCLICGKPLVDAEIISPAGYYAETADGQLAGFLEEECFSSLVFRHFYNSQREIGAADPLRDLFRESAQRSYFVLRRAPNTRNFYQQQVSFYRFDEAGLEVSNKTIELQEFESRSLGRERTLLFSLASRALFDAEGRLGDGFLLIRRVSTDFPEEILFDEQQDRFTATRERIATQLL